MQTTANLAQLASAGKPQVEADSTYRRLQRFFAGFSFGYEPLGRFLLDLVPTEAPYAAILDRTEWHFGQTAVNVLMIGIAESGIAYPVAWSVLGHGGGSGAGEHTELLDRFLRFVEPDDLRALVADREPAGSDFLKALDQREILFVIRLKRVNLRIGGSGLHLENHQESGRFRPKCLLGPASRAKPGSSRLRKDLRRRVGGMSGHYPALGGGLLSDPGRSKGRFGLDVGSLPEAVGDTGVFCGTRGPEASGWRTPM